MIELLACKLGRKDEVANIELAKKLATSCNHQAILEIVNGYKSVDTAVANDCIKVLYEIAQLKPELVTAYTDDFVSGLSSKNNRLIWGSMAALAYISPLVASKIYPRLAEIIAAYHQGSVITIDNSITVFANLCKANTAFCQEILPLLTFHFTNCRPKEIPQHAQRLAAALSGNAKTEVLKIIENRFTELSTSQQQRLNKILKGF